MPVFFPTKFNRKIRYVYNPDENPRHACGPVTVPTTSDAALPSSRGNRSSGHRRYSSSGIRPRAHPQVTIKSISSTANARRFNPKRGASQSLANHSCHPLHSSQQTVCNKQHLTTPRIIFELSAQHQIKCLANWCTGCKEEEEAACVTFQLLKLHDKQKIRYVSLLCRIKKGKEKNLWIKNSILKQIINERTDYKWGG